MKQGVLHLHQPLPQMGNTNLTLKNTSTIFQHFIYTDFLEYVQYTKAMIQGVLYLCQPLPQMRDTGLTQLRTLVTISQHLLM